MTKFNPLPGNSQKTPENERLTTVEAPSRLEVMNEGDISVASLYPLAVRAAEQIAAATANVDELSARRQQALGRRAAEGDSYA